MSDPVLECASTLDMHCTWLQLPRHASPPFAPCLPCCLDCQHHPIQYIQPSSLLHRGLITSLLYLVGSACAQKVRQNNFLSQRRQARYLKRNYKFGIKLPKTVEQALALDAKNGNNFWAGSIAKEMENDKVAFGSYQMGQRFSSTTTLCNVIWYETSKWRTSDVSLCLWQVVTWPKHQ